MNYCYELGVTNIKSLERERRETIIQFLKLIDALQIKIDMIILIILCVSFFTFSICCSAFVSKNNKLIFEQTLYQKGYEYIIGTDEVGRGAIAGPVLSTSCCIFHHNNNQELLLANHDLINGVYDSKQVSEMEREYIYQQVMEQPSIYKFTCAQRTASDIDQMNIFKATMACFQASIQDLILQENIPLDLAYAICDGQSTPKLVGGPTPIPCRPMVNADAKVYVVSLASIIAKVTRDRIMVQAHEEWPHYNFHLNKGYSTRDHIERIHKFGPCPLHRMSFRALKYR
jgi:ribonuclease HII